MSVHKNENQVARLIQHLAADFDVYVHVDKRSSIKILPQENVHVYSKYKVYWGSLNLVKATLLLLKNANLKRYDRYICISGQDLPLKSNIEIINFFDNNPNEYIDVNKLPTKFWVDHHGGLDRVNRYWPTRKGFDRWNVRKFKLKKLILDATLNRKERPLDYEFYGGSNWFDITNICVGKILECLNNDKKILKRFRWTMISDELFFQTVVAKLDGIKIAEQVLRYIDWFTGPEYPRTLRKDDYANIVNSDALFARKFDPDVDSDVIEMIYDKIKPAL